MELKDWLNSINFYKNNLLEEDPSLIKDYAPYIINRCLSGNLDCIMFVNEMNKYPVITMAVSYNSDQLVKDRFKKWSLAEFDLTYTMRSVGKYMGDQKERKELLLFNYPIAERIAA